MRRYSSVRFKVSYIVVVSLALAVLLVSALFVTFDEKLVSIVTESAEQQTSEIIYNELDSYLKEKGDLGELIHISCDDEDNITSITTDSARVNAINSELGTRLSCAVNKLTERKASFPVGTLSGLDCLSGKGFDIDVSYHSISNVSTQIVSEFESCGINQTKHSLKLLISVKINAVMPAKDVNISTEQEFLIAETVIVGRIPSVYLNND